MVVSRDSDEPKTFSLTIASSAKELWIKAMNEEMKSMKSNQVWDLGNKCLCIKRKANGIIERYKARLIAKKIYLTRRYRV